MTITDSSPETLTLPPAWQTTDGILHAPLRSELLRAEVALYVDPVPQDGRYAWVVGQGPMLVGGRATTVEEAKLCARMTGIGVLLRGGVREVLAPHLTPGFDPPPGQPFPGGWTQQQEVQPWWSARAKDLYLQVTTRLDSLYAWQVWDGHLCLARGTASDPVQAALEAEQAAARSLSSAPAEPGAQPA